MDRLVFIGHLALGTLALPHVVCAQTTGRVFRIGVLGFSASTPSMIGPQPRNPYVNALLLGLRELGYVYGENFVTEPRGAEGKTERYPSLAAELLDLRVDVFVAVDAALPALKQATSTVPVVFAGHSDPVGRGIVQSLGRPGANFTGLSLQSVELTGKRLELLSELVPTSAPLAVIWDRLSHPTWQAAEAAARQRGWKLVSLEIRNVDEIDAAFRAAIAARAAAVLVSAGSLLEPHRRRVTDLATKSRLPAIYPLRFYVDVGGLMSYSADLLDIWRRAATFVDKILKGAKPADLPVEQPTKFELVINLKIAKALGLTIPQSVLLRADQLIE